jgi:hypothetical protein
MQSRLVSRRQRDDPLESQNMAKCRMRGRLLPESYTAAEKSPPSGVSDTGSVAIAEST